MRDEWRCSLCTSIAGTIGRSKADRSLCNWCADDLARRGLFRCRKCNARTPLDELHKDQHRKWCTACRSERRRASYERNREKERAAAAAWRDANPERLRENGRRWLEANRERRSAYNRQWRHENAERVRQYRKRHYERHRDKALAQQARWKREHREYKAAYDRLYRVRRVLRILRGQV